MFYQSLTSHRHDCVNYAGVLSWGIFNPVRPKVEVSSLEPSMYCRLGGESADLLFYLFVVFHLVSILCIPAPVAYFTLFRAGLI